MRKSTLKQQQLGARTAIVRLLAAGSTISLVASPALADWQYTKWGMAPADAVAASSGMLKATSGGEGGGVGGTTQGAKGSYQQGSRTFITQLFFLNNALVYVDLSLMGDPDCQGLRGDLTSLYGQPSPGGGPMIPTYLWSDRSHGNTVKLISPGYGFCTVRYSPLTTAGL